MMGLTDRLKTLAQQINKGETMADIGTDHGFLPIYLIQNGISPRVIMTDISEKALSKARNHGEPVEGIRDIDVRAGDGLDVLAPGEVDAVVIAGIGGILMTEILSADPVKTKTFSKFIFQPRNHPEVLRIWLAEQGFRYLNEILVREGKNICEVIVASPKEASKMDKTSNVCPLDDWPPDWPHADFRWEVPPWYQSMDQSLVDAYLRRKLEQQQRILWSYQEGSNPKPDRLRQLNQRILYLEEMLKNRRMQNETG